MANKLYKNINFSKGNTAWHRVVRLLLTNQKDHTLRAEPAFVFFLIEDRGGPRGAEAAHPPPPEMTCYFASAKYADMYDMYSQQFTLCY